MAAGTWLEEKDMGNRTSSMPTAEQLLNVARSYPERNRAFKELEAKKCSEQVIRDLKEAVVAAATDRGLEWHNVIVRCEGYETDGPAMKQLQRADWKSILPEGYHVKVGWKMYELGWIPYVCVHWNGECLHEYKTSR